MGCVCISRGSLQVRWHTNTSEAVDSIINDREPLTTCVGEVCLWRACVKALRSKRGGVSFLGTSHAPSRHEQRLLPSTAGYYEIIRNSGYELGFLLRRQSKQDINVPHDRRLSTINYYSNRVTSFLPTMFTPRHPCSKPPLFVTLCLYFSVGLPTDVNRAVNTARPQRLDGTQKRRVPALHERRPFVHDLPSYDTEKRQLRCTNERCPGSDACCGKGILRRTFGQTVYDWLLLIV